MRVIVTAAIAILLTAVSAFFVFFLVPTSAPVPVVEPPKLAHHVVYFWVCDELIGALTTTKPHIWSPAEDGIPPNDIVDLMLEAELTGRAISIQHWHPGCFIPPVPDPEEST